MLVFGDLRPEVSVHADLRGPGSELMACTPACSSANIRVAQAEAVLSQALVQTSAKHSDSEL